MNGLRYRGGAALAALLLLLTPIAAAADEAPSVVYPKLAAFAPDPAGFVPKGWALERQVAGDLNGDSVKDFALVFRDLDDANVIPNPTGAGDPEFDTNPRILAVAFGRAGGGYDLAFSNHALIPRPTNPAADDFLDDVTIERGTLRVALHLALSAGGWGTSKAGYVFRFQNGRFALIGYDGSTVQRNTGKMVDVSVNYATGKAKVTVGSIEDDKPGRGTWKTLPPRQPLSLDGVGDGIQFNPGIGTD